MKHIILQYVNPKKNVRYLIFVNYSTDKQLPVDSIIHRRGDNVSYEDILYYSSLGFKITVQE